MPKLYDCPFCGGQHVGRVCTASRKPVEKTPQATFVDPAIVAELKARIAELEAGKKQFDKKAYQREYMRKRRAK